VAPVDFRKSINGLVAVVEQSLKLDAFAPALYAFGNRRRDKVKVLTWDRNGFWLHYKRLERDRFAWPRQGETTVRLTLEQLGWLLQGYDLGAMRGHTAFYVRRAS
jgi:transposase